MKYDTRDVCIVDDGYLLLQQFPFNKNHSVTTMFDAKGNIVQWYIDICLENGMTDVSHYDLANKEASDIIGLVKNNNFRLLHLSVSHKDCLKNNLR